METILLEKIRQIFAGEKIEERENGVWVTLKKNDLLKSVQALLDTGARLSTITALLADNEETELLYHFVLEKTALNLRITTQNNRIISITPICLAADWVEREIHDLYAVDFGGHPDLSRLLRPAELKIGYYREPGGAAGKVLREQKKTEMKNAL